MKPTSVIFLIFSVILIASGIGVIFLAESMADSEDVALFSQSVDENGNLCEIYDFSDQSIDRITMTLGDADVNVYGNSERSYIELINFPRSTYDLSVSSKTINIDNTLGVFSLTRIKENGFSFSGLRHYLNMKDYEDKQKTVNVYLKSDDEVKVFNFAVENGNASVSDIKSSADYSIKLENGDLNFVNVYTRSTVNVMINKGNAVIDNCEIINGEISTKSGDINYTLDTHSTQKLLAMTKNGTVYFNGNDVGTELNHDPAVFHITIAFSTDDGDINISAKNVLLI